VPMPADRNDEGEISLVSLTTTIVRNLRWIALWSLAGGVFALVKATQRPVLYQATALFSTQGGSSQQLTGLSALAGQLGLANASAANMTSSPGFYVMIMKSPVLLSRIIRDTLTVAEKGGQRMTIVQLLEIKGNTPFEVEDRAMKALRGMVTPENRSGLVQVTANTPWSSVSLSLVTAYLRAIEEYNREARRTQAAVERGFVEQRMAEAQLDLHAAEDRLQRFLSSNREIATSSGLAFERDRLARIVQLKQQVFLTLATSYEDARIREVRDTPVISVIEPPRANPEPEGRKRPKRTLIGLVLGAFVGLVVTLLVDSVRRIARHRPAETDELAATVREARASVTKVLRIGR